MLALRRPLPLPPFAEDGRGSSGIDTGKSIGLSGGILLPTEAVDSNRSVLELEHIFELRNLFLYIYHLYGPGARINFQTEIVNGELSGAKWYLVTQ